MVTPGSGRSGRRVLIVVQNLPLPGDRRVWLECQSLRDAGYEVTAITPKAPNDPGFALLDGIRLYKYDPPPAAASFLGFAWEFLYCFIRTTLLAFRVLRRHGIDVLQACNPPDTYWLLARMLRPFGVKYVFDQHDLCPEVYLSRFPQPNPLVLQALRALESLTYRTADEVIATNDSYRRMAMTRGRVPSASVTVVRTGPDDARMRRGPPDASLRRDRRFLAVYVGVMGPQDGVDLAVRAAHAYIEELGHHDCTFALLGAGDCWEALRALVVELGLQGHLEMPGRVSDELLFRYLSTADVGLCPDPPGPLNDVSTMNKTMEYMAFGLPVLAFDLHETRVSAGEAGLYVAEPTSSALARGLDRLLQDPEHRAEMGNIGRDRVERVLAWRHQSPAYVDVLRRLET